MKSQWFLLFVTTIFSALSVAILIGKCIRKLAYDLLLNVIVSSIVGDSKLGNNRL